jgi:hypothetical protein
VGEEFKVNLLNISYEISQLVRHEKSQSSFFLYMVIFIYLEECFSIKTILAASERTHNHQYAKRAIKVNHRYFTVQYQ